MDGRHPAAGPLDPLETQSQFALKRATGLVVSSILLLLLAPAFAPIAILVKLDSRGPVFVLEERVGVRSGRPGMTGLWQVSGRSDVGFDEWVELDLAHIDSWSLVQDFFILLKTFRAVFAGRGAS